MTIDASDIPIIRRFSGWCWSRYWCQQLSHIVITFGASYLLGLLTRQIGLPWLGPAIIWAYYAAYSEGQRIVTGKGDKRFFNDLLSPWWASFADSFVDTLAKTVGTLLAIILL